MDTERAATSVENTGDSWGDTADNAGGTGDPEPSVGTSAGALSADGGREAGETLRGTEIDTCDTSATLAL